MAVSAFCSDPTLFGSDCDELSSNDHRANDAPTVRRGRVDLFSFVLMSVTRTPGEESPHRAHEETVTFTAEYQSISQPYSWKCFIEADAAKAVL